MPRTLPALLALSLFAAACGSTTDGAGQPEVTDPSVDSPTTVTTTAADSAATPETEPSTPSTTITTFDPAAGPVIRVIDQGAEPRREFRFAFEAGDHEMVVESTQTLSQTIDGESLGESPPIGTIATQTISVEPVDAGFELRTRVTGMDAAPGSDPMVAAQMEVMAAGFEDVVTVAVIDNRGRLVSSRTEGIDELDPLIQQALDGIVDNSQATTPLPEEPLGVGAVWELDQELQTGGVNLTQTIVYTVITIDDSGVELRGELVQEAELGPLDAPGLPAGTEVELLSSTGTGTVTIRFSWTSPVPESTTMFTTNQSLFITEGLSTAVLDQLIKAEVVVHS